MNHYVHSVKSMHLFRNVKPKKFLVIPKVLGTGGPVNTAITHMRVKQEEQLEPEQKSMCLKSEKEISSTQW